ncbi:MAG TPA: formimidoylglutamase [Phycisphaerales bacterium]|nr:formimidoylglutamase [Phycisphaerales bacterium]
MVTTDPSQAADCEVALLGLPDDVGIRLNNGRPGAAEGPRALRAALATYGTADPAGFSWPRIFDAGDVVPAPGVHAEGLLETHRRVTEAARALHRAGLFPIAIGGGHDLTFPFVRAAVEHHRKNAAESFAGLYFDAHLDVRATVGSGMPFRRLIEECGVGPLMIAGYNPLANAREHVEYFSTACGGRNIIADDDLVARIDDLAGPDALLSPLHNEDPGSLVHLFCSFDLDVLDASHAPGVSALNPAGLTVREAARLVFIAATHPRLRCMDFMELSPPHDDRGRTARTAAHLLLHALMGLKLGRRIEER